MRNKTRIIILLCFFILCIFGSFLTYEIELNNIREDKIKEVIKNQGNYDEKTIVLQNTTYQEATKLSKLLNAKLRINSQGNFATLKLPNSLTVNEVIKDSAYRKYLKDISLDYKAFISETEEENIPNISRPNYEVNDTYYSEQSYLDYINMSNVWDKTKGNGITVAIIDTGIDYNHSEFKGKISEFSYNATTEQVVKNHGLEVIKDNHGHGTNVAGVIGASMDGSGITGIAPEVELLIIKAECNSLGGFNNTSDLVFGLYYAIEQGADVVNMSFGGYDIINHYENATKLAVDNDIICVAAAGNNSTTMLNYPAADTNVIGVGALENDSFKLASYSNYGENVNLVAPGITYTTDKNNTYKANVGTSLSSPIVSASIALYLSLNSYQTYEDVTQMLYASCFDLGALGNDFEYGYGALDVSAFVLEEKGKITFDMLTDEIDDIETVFVRNHTLQNIPEPERIYEVFDGWYYDMNFTEEYNYYEDIFTTDITLYAKWVNEDEGLPYRYQLLSDNTIEITQYIGKRKYITIPEEIEGKKVTSIGAYAFNNNTRLKQVILPNSITNIKRNAFSNCTNLVDITIPNNVKEIQEYAFYNNIRLRNIIITNESKLETIGTYAFSNTSLTKINLPKSLLKIENNAFYGTQGLKEIIISKDNINYVSIDNVLYNKAKDTLILYPAGLK